MSKGNGSTGRSSSGRKVSSGKPKKSPLVEASGAHGDLGRPDTTGEIGGNEDRSPKMPKDQYESDLRQLQVELVAMQEWVKGTGAKVCVVFEGRDTAGKGGTIECITERVSPRVFRVVALPAPNEREKSQMYMQRYISQFPSAGEVVLFDRSWYNRAGVEPVMGFCTQEETDRFLAQTPGVEKSMIDAGIILLKYWLEVGQKEQKHRLEARIKDGRKVWKLSPVDVDSYAHWYDYSRARDAMFEETDTPWAPWWVVNSDDKRRARINVISHMLSKVPYEPLSKVDVTFPSRQSADGYVEPNYPFHFVPDVTRI